MTHFELAQRYVGIAELKEPGKDHPLIQWWLSLCGFGTDSPDETPWCSAFLNGIAWEMRLPRSKSAAARSWLQVGQVIQPYPEHMKVGDVVVLNRGGIPDPNATGPGHVGLYAGSESLSILLLGGNQGDAVCVKRFKAADILGIRRIVGEA